MEPEKEIRKISWAKELDYNQIYRKIAQTMPLFRGKFKPRGLKAFVHLSVLLVQLRNGSRVSEAIEAIEKFTNSKEKEIQVRARKRKRTYARTMIIPAEVRVEDIPQLKAAMPISIAAVKVFAARRLGINTHSLRYAFITHLSRQGIAPQVIARITGHTKLDYVLHYTERPQADEILRKVK